MSKLETIRLFVLLSVGLTVVGGCSRESSQQNPESAVAVATETQAAAYGKQLFGQHCAQCHEGSGAVRAPNQLMLANQTADAIERALTIGIMQEQGAALTPEERRAVAEFVSPPGSSVSKAPVLCENAAMQLHPPPLSGWGVDLANTRRFHAPLTDLSRETLARLKLKWVFAYPGANRARAQPSPIGDSVLVGSHDGTVYALAADSGCARWRFQADAEVRSGITVIPADNEATAPLAVFGDLRANVYVIDATTGELVWRTRVDDHVSGLITAQVTYFQGTVYVPITSLEKGASISGDYPCCTFRGAVAALDARSGEQRWKTYTIPEAPQQIGVNATGAPIYAPSGAGVWGSLTVDPVRGLLYLGTGNAYTAPAHENTDAIIAMDLASGDIRWVRQTLAGDAWNGGCMQGLADNMANCPEDAGPDFDFGAPPMLLSIDGRDILVAGQKSGDVWGLDPNDDGRILWRRKVGAGSVFGGIHYGLAADDRTVYAAPSDFDDGQGRDVELRPGVNAIDAVSGELLWHVPANDVCAGREACHPGVSAPLSAFPGFVLAGHSDGRLRAYAKESGQVLWEFDTARKFTAISGEEAHGGAIGGASGPIAYGDMLYVNSGYGFVMQMPGNVLLAFELGEDP